MIDPNEWPEQEAAEKWWKDHRLELFTAVTQERLKTQRPKEPQENYPKGWVKVVLMISETGEMHAIGGEREPGEGDMSYIGLERIRRIMHDKRSE